ncbi:MAG TPA: hypothetical protein VJI15_05920 [Candidatus Nanoarchaeia archaeon]|nr:hypothetical protein [Candidatus Nanoarchaeia archaeon]
MSGQKTEARTVQQMLREGALSFDQLVKLNTQGNMDMSKKYSPAEIAEMLGSSIEPLTRTTVTYDDAVQHGADHVEIVLMSLPGSGIQYLTTMVGGKVVLSRDREGHLDLSSPVPLEDVLDYYAQASLGSAPQPFGGKKKKTPVPGPDDKGGKRKGDDGSDDNPPPPKPRPTKDRPQVVADPSISQLFYQYGRTIACAEGDRSALGDSSVHYRGRDALEGIIDDPAFLDQADSLNLDVQVFSLGAFLNTGDNKTRIRKTQKRLNAAIQGDPEIRSIAGMLVGEYTLYADYVLTFPDNIDDLEDVVTRVETELASAVPEVRLSPFAMVYKEEKGKRVGLRIPLTISGSRSLKHHLDTMGVPYTLASEERASKKVDKKQAVLRALCEDVSSVRYLYERLTTARDEVESTTMGEHYLAVFRDLALGIIREVSVSGQLITDEERSTYHQTTRKWTLFARSADFTMEEPYIRDVIVPELKQDSDLDSRDRAFTITARLGRFIVDRRMLLGSASLSTYIRGLTMRGLFGKGRGDKERKVTGTTQFTDGYANILANRETYHGLFMQHLNALVQSGDEGSVDREPLATQKGCESFGRRVYDAMPGKAQNKFARLSGDQAPLSRSERSTYLNRTLGLLTKMYIDDVERSLQKGHDGK